MPPKTRPRSKRGRTKEAQSGLNQHIPAARMELNANMEVQNGILMRATTKRVRPNLLEQSPPLSSLNFTQSGSTPRQQGMVQPNASTPTQSNPVNRPTIGKTSNMTIHEGDPIDIETEPIENDKKKTRGPTCMPKIWGQQVDKRVVVSFNELGQPNDEKETSTLAHFLGTIARNGKYCPLNYTDWRLMPNSCKEEMLKLVQTKFELPPGHESYILKSINKKWRNWKSRVKNLNFDPDVPVEDQMLEIPDRVDKQQYLALVDHWFCDNTQLICEKNKKTRAQLEFLHRMGKKSFALVKEIMKKKHGREVTRAELFEECYYKVDGSDRSHVIYEAIEQMKQLASEEPQNTNDGNSFHDSEDTFAKVMGKDKNGQLRMYGMGVTPADVYGEIPSRATSYRMAMEYKEKYLNIIEKYDALNERVEDLSTMVRGRAESVVQPNSHTSPAACPTNQSSSRSTPRAMPIRLRSFVVLKSLGNINEIVASGYVNAMDSIVVNGESLGSDWCEIIIQCSMKRDTCLLKPYGHILTIGDALGAPVVWPNSLVTLDENVD